MQRFWGGVRCRPEGGRRREDECQWKRGEREEREERVRKRRRTTHPFAVLQTAHSLLSSSAVSSESGVGLEEGVEVVAATLKRREETKVSSRLDLTSREGRRAHIYALREVVELSELERSSLPRVSGSDGLALEVGVTRNSSVDDGGGGEDENGEEEEEGGNGEESSHVRE